MSLFGYLLLAGTLLGVCYCYVRPAFAFVLVMALYPAKQLIQSYLGFFANNSAYYNYIIFLGVLIAAASNMIQRAEARRGYANRVWVIMIVMYLYGLFAILWSPAPGNAMRLASAGMPYWAMQVLLLPLCVARLDDFRRVQTLGVIVGCALIVLFFTNPKASFMSGRLTLNIGDLSEVRGNPLATAQLGSCVAVMSALMLPERAGWLMNIIRMGGLALGLGIAVAAGSRGQLLAGAVCALAFYPLARQVRDMKQFLGTAVGFAVMGMVGLVTIKVFLSQDAEQASRWNIATWIEQLDERSGLAFDFLFQWMANPTAWPLGFGSNAFSAGTEDSHVYAHNLPIEMLAELGIVGFSMFAATLYFTYRVTRDLWRVVLHGDPYNRAAAAVLMALTSCLTLLSFKQGSFLSIPEPWFLIAILAKVATVERDAWLAAHGPVHVEEQAYLAETYGEQPQAG